jgi:hypothetical protein
LDARNDVATGRHLVSIGWLRESATDVVLKIRYGDRTHEGRCSARSLEVFDDLGIGGDVITNGISTYPSVTTAKA